MPKLFTVDGASSPPRSPGSPHSPDSLSSIIAFARFEFELGRANEGTKILMVEFEDDDTSRDPAGTWQVSWSGKTTVLPADERTAENNRRLYFLLPPGTTIPPRVVLSYNPPAESAPGSKAQRLTVNPLPAIFSPDLGASARSSGKKGVLHTIWAKKRLQVLDREIKREEEYNLEGIALDLAKSEKEWIENNFGVTTLKLPGLDLSGLSNYPNGPISPGLNTPRSPGGRKLSEKLRGLSIGTKDRDLAPRDAANTPSHDSHPLSPDNDDVAYSSFSQFRKTAAASTTAPAKQRVKAQMPPEQVRRQQSKQNSMDSVTKSRPLSPRPREPSDELFAKALSPRSPDDAKSPFSFSPAETMPYAQIKGKR